MRIRLLCSLLLLLSSASAFAYPSFIGYGYTSCVVCHYNAAGNGPLTDYGRALSANTISAKPFFEPNATDEELASQSSFTAGLVELPFWLRPSFFFRELYYDTGIEGNTPSSRFIVMQLEGSLVLKSRDQNLFANATVGYAPVPQAVPANQRDSISTLVTHEHYVAYRFSKEFTLYAGYLDQAFGIRTADHNAYIRENLQLNYNDQTHALQFHLAGKKWESVLQAVAGDLYQDSSIRQAGGSGVFEYEFFPNTRIGASLLATSSTFRTREMAAVHGRFGFLEGSSILAETGFSKELSPSAPSLLKQYLFFQSSNRLSRGLFFLATVEYYSPDNYTLQPGYYRAGPSLQYFAFQRLELRADFQSTLVYSPTTVIPEIYTFFAQVHVWL